MKIAFLFIAEAYQCYHGAAVAFAARRHPGVEVTSYYNDPDSVRHLERIRLAYGEAPLLYVRMRRNLFARAIQSLKILGFVKWAVYPGNARRWAGYDAIFTVEDTAWRLFRGWVRRPAKIYMPHGAGDGRLGFTARAAAFDFVILPGPKSAARMLHLGYVTPQNHACVGLVKLETAQRLYEQSATLFDNTRPTVFYNAHKKKGLESWSIFIEPLLAAFGQSDEYNLIVAPHVKRFHRSRRAVRDRWEARGSPHIIIDTGSDRAVDMSYTRAADIYLGDVSSQVYEFLLTPRPCVFINAHDIDWRDDPDFAHWHLGDVITHPSQLMGAIRAAPARHALYRDRQETMAATSLGDRSPGAAGRAAAAMLGFLGPQSQP
jgi:hypothetical protein